MNDIINYIIVNESYRQLYNYLNDNIIKIVINNMVILTILVVIINLIFYQSYIHELHYCFNDLIYDFFLK